MRNSEFEMLNNTHSALAVRWLLFLQLSALYIEFGIHIVLFVGLFVSLCSTNFNRHLPSGCPVAILGVLHYRYEVHHAISKDQLVTVLLPI